MSKTPIPPALIVSLVAPAWTVAIVSLQSGAKLLEQLGVASEEIFRGDRLPVLHFPVTESLSPGESPELSPQV
jgi:hypothetical protein